MTTIEQRKQRWNDFYRADGETKVLFHVKFNPPYSAQFAKLLPECKQERIDFTWRHYLEDLERSTWLEDDYIPNFLLVTGTELYAEALGSQVFCPKDHWEWPRAEPIIFSPQDAEKVRFPKLEDSTLMLYFDIADELQRRGGKDVLFNLPNMLCPMDIVAQLWEKTDLYLTMIDEPEVILELSEKIRTFFLSFTDEWFHRYGTEFIGHYPFYYMNGGISITVDEIGTISSDMYRQFFEKDLDIIARRYGGMGIHCCADSRHQWDNLSRIPGLRMLNIVRPEKTLREAYSYFKDIAALWPEKMEGGVPEPMVNPAKESLPAGCRLVLTENASTRDEALRIAEQLHRKYR
ncbi:MAG: hypothetical protein IJ412_12095 [Oscillospiraceae bacterium]|nr:hypothetical protein [Oscillospiraceae bacterium]